MRRLLVLLLIFALLAPAVPVKAESTYYALSFDGEDDYVEVADSTSLDVSTEFTLIAIVKIESYPDAGATDIIDKKSAINHGFWLHSDGRIGTEIYNGSTYFSTISSNILSLCKTYFLTSRFSSSLGVLEVLVDLQIWAKRTDVAGVIIANSPDPLVIGKNVLNNIYFNGNVYLVLFYNRYLDDSELQQIYNDPLNPPTDGLVLFYAPDSVDTANGKWLDKSGNGNDGTIYGATAERVSIINFDVRTLSGVKITSNLTINDTTANIASSLTWFPVPFDLKLHIFNVSHPNFGYSLLSTTPNANKNISVTLGVYGYVQNMTVSESVSTTLADALGSNYAVGFLALVLVGGVILINRHHVAVAGAALVPLLMALAMSGYLPSWLSYIVFFTVGILVFYIVVTAIGGGNR